MDRQQQVDALNDAWFQAWVNIQPLILWWDQRKLQQNYSKGNQRFQQAEPLVLEEQLRSDKQVCGEKEADDHWIAEGKDKLCSDGPISHNGAILVEAGQS